MKRRDFIKCSLVAGMAVMMPDFTYANTLDTSKIHFTNNNSNVQTIVVFLSGGASQLAGNISNIDEIKQKSQSDYDTVFKGITATKNNCWAEAGGTEMEDLIKNEDMTLFRCCYSAVREESNNKAHGQCASENKRGSFKESSDGMFTSLARVLEENGIINSDTILPFVDIGGGVQFYNDEEKSLSPNLRPVSISPNFQNPYKRWGTRNKAYYTEAEKSKGGDGYFFRDRPVPKLNDEMDFLSQQINKSGKIKEAFNQRGILDRFIDEVKTSKTPDLGENPYPVSGFSNKLEAAIKILNKNPDTKVVTIGSVGGLGGWDDHENGKAYVYRMRALFKALKAAMTHLKAISKEQTINIILFGEFGRNINLNTANGWDHGNLQNVYVLGGKDYFTHKGIIGETSVVGDGSNGRIFHRPKSGTYWFEPLSIAATLYKIYGIDNPEDLTGGYKELEPLFGE